MKKVTNVTPLYPYILVKSEKVDEIDGIIIPDTAEGRRFVKVKELPKTPMGSETIRVAAGDYILVGSRERNVNDILAASPDDETLALVHMKDIIGILHLEEGPVIEVVEGD